MRDERALRFSEFIGFILFSNNDLFLFVRERAMDPVAFTVKIKEVLVVGPERLAMRDSDECDAKITAHLVHLSFNVDRNGARALVEDRVSVEK